MPRLIDAEPLVEYFKGLVRSMANARCFGAADAIQGAAEKLRNAPTIDAEPVRHGRWLPKKVGAVTTEFECSECGRTVTHANDYYGKATKHVSSYYPYCHCGAKMDEEVQR